MDLGKKGRWVFCSLGLGIPLLFILIGLLVIGSRTYKLKYWKDQEARVIASEVVSYLDSEGSTLYKAKIEYRYNVDGREHFGSFQTTSSNFVSGADHTVQRYPKDAAIQIKVNPSNPSASILPERPSLLWYFFTLFGGITFGIFITVGIRLGLLGQTRPPQALS